jgi:hypothetical protein
MLRDTDLGWRHFSPPAHMRAVPMASMLIILSSCGILQDLRNGESANKLVAAGHYKDVGACIVRAWNGRTNDFYSLMVDEGHQKAFITSSLGGTINVSADDTTVAQIDATDVAVQEGKPPGLAGDSGWSWKSIQDCVGDHPTESAQMPTARERLDIRT